MYKVLDKFCYTLSNAWDTSIKRGGTVISTINRSFYYIHQSLLLFNCTVLFSKSEFMITFNLRVEFSLINNIFQKLLTYLTRKYSIRGMTLKIIILTTTWGIDITIMVLVLPKKKTLLGSNQPFQHLSQILCCSTSRDGSSIILVGNSKEHTF